jgi:exodeoxyribonuclease (lambda-induced)
MVDNPQEAAAWVAKRVGKVTASSLHKIARRKKDGNPYASYEDYRAEIALERLTGRAADHFVTPAMEVGTAREPEAALAYAMETGAELAFSDFVPHPTIEAMGASPDRLVGSEGLVEIKCPQPKAHFDFLMTGAIKPEYYWQCQAQMACTGRKWDDLFYYNPDFPPHLQTKRIRIERNDDDIRNAESLVIIFDQECEAMLAKLAAEEAQAA